MLSSLKNLSVTLLAIAQTRLSLLGNELQAQKILLIQLLSLLLALMFCAGLAILLGLGLVVSVWWEQRVLVLGLSAIIFLALALFCFLRLQSLLNPAEVAFDASLAALKDDMAMLRAATQNSKPLADQKQTGSARE